MCYDYYAVPVLPRLLVAFEDQRAAEALKDSVKENVTVAAPKFNIESLTADTFDKVLLIGSFCDTADMRIFYHNHVHPSAKKTAEWIWV